MLKDYEMTRLQETGRVESYEPLDLDSLLADIDTLGISRDLVEIREHKHCVLISVLETPPVRQVLTPSSPQTVSDVKNTLPRFVVSSTPASKERATQETVNRLKASGASNEVIALAEMSVAKQNKPSLWKRIFS